MKFQQMEKMNRHKCDMCGLYLIGDEMCLECVHSAETVKKVAEKGRIGVDYGRNETECNNGGYEDYSEF